MNTSAVSIVDLAARRLLATVLLDELDRGAANPWGVTCSADGAWLCVAHAGTHEVSVIDRPALHERLNVLAAAQTREGNKSLADVANDLSFLVGIRRRLPLPGNGPRGLTFVGSHLVAAQYFTDDLAVLRREPGGFTAASARALGPAMPLTTTRRGDMFFHDSRLCFQHWQSCSSCHPDARVDGLNWDLLNDGVGNPKNTRTMLAAHRVAPVVSLGQRETAEQAVRAGLKSIQFAVRPEEDAAAIDAYLRSLEPGPSPRLVNGRLSAAAERGKALFARGCITCHPPPLFTDMQSHHVGTGTGLERDKAFVTPRLVEVWRTAPYLHDGSARSVQEAIVRHDRAATDLTPQELDDLAEYVLSY